MKKLGWRIEKESKHVRVMEERSVSVILTPA